MLKSDYKELRDMEVVYYFSHLMIREFYTSREHGQQFQKFPDIRRIVETWYNEQLEIIGGDGSPEQKRLVMLWNYKAVLDNINEGIHKANADHEEITAVLNYYNPEGSTRYVYRPTNKPVCPTQKSHVNYVIAEDNSWHEIAAKTLDAMDCVEAWVRNQYLGFRIPYTVGDEDKEYLPTFIVKTKDVNLIVECQDFDGDGSGNKEAKRHYLKDYWIPAANNLKTFGRWQLLEVRDIDQLEDDITKCLENEAD
jgi:type III restriction enzyme